MSATCRQQAAGPISSFPRPLCRWREAAGRTVKQRTAQAMMTPLSAKHGLTVAQGLGAHCVGREAEGLPEGGVTEGSCVLVGGEQQIAGGRYPDEIEAGGERGDGTYR